VDVDSHRPRPWFGQASSTDPDLGPPIRTIPIRVEPVAGESLDSWLEAYASRTHTALGDLLNALGHGEDTSSPRARHRRSMLSLTPAQLASIAHATAIAPAALRSLTLASLVDSTSDQSAVSSALISPTSRFCPKCLDSSGGRWQLWWRLRWACACPAHHCLLADTCPHCSRRQRVDRLPQPYVPELGACTRRALDGGGRYARRCAARLSSTKIVDLGADHPALEAQRELLTAFACVSIEHGIYAESPVSAVQFAADMTALGQRILRYASPGELRARIPDDLWQAHERAALPNPERSRSSPPWPPSRDASSVTAAIAASVAMPILDSHTIASGGKRLRSLISPTRRSGLSVSETNIGWGCGASEALIAVQLSSLSPFLGPLDQLRYRCWAPRPRRPHRESTVHASVPALLWPRLAVSISAPHTGFTQLRSALSAAVVMVGSRIDVRLACVLLGSATSAPAVSQVLQVLRTQPCWATTASLLTNLAEWLDRNPSPIDYERRRQLPVEDLLPELLWRRICRDTAAAVSDSATLSLHRCWLYERITGSPARCSPLSTDTRKFYAKLADLPRSLTPELAGALEEYGLEFLGRHGLGHEPLQWQPPSETLGASASS
jgi:hypothetical protein